MLGPGPPLHSPGEEEVGGANLVTTGLSPLALLVAPLAFHSPFDLPCIDLARSTSHVYHGRLGTRYLLCGDIYGAVMGNDGRPAVAPDDFRIDVHGRAAFTADSCRTSARDVVGTTFSIKLPMTQSIRAEPHCVFVY